MKRMHLVLIVMLTGFVGVSNIGAEENSPFIFGTITLDNGDQLTGRIRWDKNEGIWEDVLDAQKVDHDRLGNDRERRRRSRVSVFGLDIVRWEGTRGDATSSGIRFGYIESIEPRSSDRAYIYVRGGDRVRFEGSSTDLGSSMREIVIDDEQEGEVELDWSDIDEVRFQQEPASYVPSDPTQRRLYGRVRTEAGEEFVGYVTWDQDEIFGEDILDGEDDGRDRNIRFEKIQRIEKKTSSSCLVKLFSGREYRLSGTNDVDSGNRGVTVHVAPWGLVKIAWEEFEDVEFLEDAPSVRYDDYDKGGRRLYGTVTTDEGDEHTGWVIWDDDERYAWEFLDGDRHGIEYEIEFGSIAMIERRSSRSADVQFSDGMSVRLRGSNDVTDENGGIFIEDDDGDYIEVDWDEFERVVFDHSKM